MNIHLYPSEFKQESRIEKQATLINKIIGDKKILLLGAGKGKFIISNNLEVVLLGRKNTKVGKLRIFA